MLALLLAFALTVPELTGPVVDPSGFLDAAERTRVESALLTLEKSGKAQMALLVVPDLGDEPIENYSIAVAEKWKLGKKGADKGLLFVVAPKNRKMRLEVGYGLEGEITDVFSKRLLSREVAPFFREGKYADGIVYAIGAVAEKLGVEGGIDSPPPRAYREPSPVQTWVVGLFGLALLVLIFFGAFFRQATPYRRGRYGTDWSSGGWGSSSSWGGGDSGGGGGGFSGGGGGFGGGGASSDW